jgi:putative ABC transport system permease protein
VKTPAVAPGYFEALRVPVRGKTVDWAETDRGATSVVVTRAFADKYWPGEDPIGKGIRGEDDRPPYYHVVGVAGDLRAEGLHRPPMEAVFFPTTRAGNLPLGGPYRFMAVVVRTSVAEPYTLVPALRRAAREVNPNVPIFDVRTMEEVVARSPSVARASFTMLLLSLAGGMALLLSAVGLYGVISYVVAQRRSEIGIRMALGANIAQVGGLVLRQALTLALAGIAAGLVVALSTTRVLRSVLFEISPSDPLTLGAVSLILLAVAAFAAFGPARRAAGVDPAESLRAQ